MPRRVFYSFCYNDDNWRTSQVRNIGIVEGNRPAADNDWETIKKGGDPAIQKWIDSQLKGRSCTVVLIGENTAGRKWIDYEIKKSFSEGMGLVGIHIYNLLDSNSRKSKKGKNPFDGFKYKDSPLNKIFETYDPPGSDSTAVYDHIKRNLADWIEEAISIRNKVR